MTLLLIYYLMLPFCLVVIAIELVIGEVLALKAQLAVWLSEMLSWLWLLLTIMMLLLHTV